MHQQLNEIADELQQLRNEELGGMKALTLIKVEVLIAKIKIIANAIEKKEV